MNSSEGTGQKGGGERSKSELVRMVKQFLLQNDLPVTAAALQMEYEKFRQGSANNARRTARSGKGGGEGGGQAQQTQKCLADWLGHNNNAEQPKMPMPPTPAEPMSPSLPPRPHPPPPSDRSSSPSKRPTRKAAGQSPHHSHNSSHHPKQLPPTSQSARTGGRSQRANSHRRPTEKGGTEEEAWPMEEEGGHGHGQAKKSRQQLRKAESMGSITAVANGPAVHQAPPDPVQARTPANAVEEEGEKLELAEAQWLSAHLDLALLGQTLLRAGPGRECALLVQALRHQLTKAGSLADGEANLLVFVAKDLLQLGNRKHCLTSVLLSESSSLPELKEQLCRLLNAIASFRRGRDYLLSVGHGRQLIYEASMALKNRRVVGHAVEHLLATLQKLSIRPSAQKELLLNGMIEWLALQLAQPKLGPAFLEFGMALLHNLASNSLAQSSLFRHKDQLLAAMCSKLGSTRNGQVLATVCGTLFTLFGHIRIRKNARERGDLERAIQERAQREQPRPEQHRQLLALGQVLRGEVDTERRKASTGVGNGDGGGEDSFPDYIEAEIDSTDPLVPAFSELFGQSLLAQKFLQAGVTPLPRREANLVQFAIQEDLESVPGTVPVHRRPRHNDAQQSGKPPKSDGLRQQFTSLHHKYNNNRPGQNAVGSKLALPKEAGGPLIRQVHFERTNSMSSHATFVVENNCRRPLLVTNGLASVVVLLEEHDQRARQERKREGDKSESISSKSLLIEEAGAPGKEERRAIEGGQSSTMAEVVKLSQRQNLQANSGMARKPTVEMAKMFSSKLRTQREKWPRETISALLGEVDDAEGLTRSATFAGGSGNERENNDGHEEIELFDDGDEQQPSSYDEYMAIFAARPKVNRTPPEDFYFDDLNE